MANRRPADPAHGAGKGSPRADRRAADRQGTRSSRPAAKAPESALARTVRRWGVPAVLAVAVVVAAGVIVAGMTAPPAPVANVVRPAQGPATAAVTVAEYSDYQCDYCGRWARQVEASFNSTFITTGKVRFEWHDDAWEGQESIDAANAARCAGDQGKFWEMHDLLYNSQNATPNTGAFTKDRLKSLGATLGLNATAFNACVDAGTYDAAVKSDTAAAQSAGINGTPAFSINGTPLEGYQTLEQMTAAIDAAASAVPAAPAASAAAASASAAP